jgi:hypothetical protein
MNFLQLIGVRLQNKFNQHTSLLNNFKKHSLSISLNQTVSIPGISDMGSFKIFDASNPISSCEVVFKTGTGTKLNQPSYSSLYSVAVNTANKLNIYMTGSTVNFQSKITGLKNFTIFQFNTN